MTGAPEFGFRETETVFHVKGSGEEKEERLRQVRAAMYQGGLQSGVPRDRIGEYADRLMELIRETGKPTDEGTLYRFTPEQCTQVIRELGIEAPWNRGDRS